MSRKTAFVLVGLDRYRYFGPAKTGWSKRRQVGGLQLLYMELFRKAQAAKGPALKVFYRLRLRRLSERTGIQIPWCCKIGKGFYIGHLGRIIVHPGASFGDNCNIATGVSVGRVPGGERAGVPVIGNRVWIGTNAVIVGGISIEDDVVVAPNSFVNFDVPAHSIVVGNPGTIHPRDPATQGYLQNLVD
jgi:serine O-acetyltransferase